MIDLSRPGHLTGCLRQFQERIGATDDNWDSSFGGWRSWSRPKPALSSAHYHPSTHTHTGWQSACFTTLCPQILTLSWPFVPLRTAAEKWRTDDMVDCMLSYAATHLVDEMTDVHSVEGMDMLERIRGGEGGLMLHAAALVANARNRSLSAHSAQLASPASPPVSPPLPSSAPADPRAAKQFLLLAHLYAKTDASSLDFLRYKLLPARYTTLQLGAAAAAGAALAGGEPRCCCACRWCWRSRCRRRLACTLLDACWRSGRGCCPPCPARRPPDGAAAPCATAAALTPRRQPCLAQPRGGGRAASAAGRDSGRAGG